AAYQRVLTVYQSRRWDPDFIALRDTVAGGGIGALFYMESFIGGYSHPCDYWHSHEPISGGTIYDWGSHYFDWVLQLFGEQVTALSAVAHKRVWHDVTNADQVRVDLTFGDGAQATFMQSDIAAALKPKWYLLGTRGAIVGEWRHETIVTRGGSGELVEHRPAPADLPSQVVVSRPGAGGMSAGKALIPAIASSHNGRLVSIASRDPARAEQMAAQHSIPRCAQSYEALLEDPEVDAVYIPLVNSLHKEWTLRALAAGKHVLCEKPLAMNALEAEEMAAAAAGSGRRLMEAFMYRFHPRTRQYVEHLRGEASPRHVQASRGFPL